MNCTVADSGSREARSNADQSYVSADTGDFEANLFMWAAEMSGYTIFATFQEPDRVVSKAGVCQGAACIRGTRIPVWGLVKAKRHGIADSQLLEMYPSLSQEDLLAAWAYAESHDREIESKIRENEGT